MSTPEYPHLARGWDSPGEFRLVEERLAPRAKLLAVTGELDIATVPGAAQAARRGWWTPAPSASCWTSKQMSFMDSVAMAAIIHTRTRLGDRG